MIINFQLGVALIILSGIVTAALSIVLLVKVKAHKRLRILGLLIGLLVMYIVGNSTTHIYEYTREKQMKSMLAFGGSSYTATDNQQVKYEKTAHSKCLVNASDVPLLIEEVTYGQSFNYGAFGPVRVEAHQYYDSLYQVNYFPDETPPASVEVNKSSSGVTMRTWVHEAVTDTSAVPGN